ncbi:hypothetical protein MB84_29030 (plasmid) [Pandoraea oxalativorans]|uniref:Uncharacterized protein n=1 Tax=Pandoraea oxalativorans TaxID=573737 RepID=A0A0G3II87_9BURK|nr:hypothetical protein MB84_29030 [Pandoraea oxalativorans]
MGAPVHVTGEAPVSHPLWHDGRTQALASRAIVVGKTVLSGGTREVTGATRSHAVVRAGARVVGGALGRGGIQVVSGGGGVTNVADRGCRQPDALVRHADHRAPPPWAATPQARGGDRLRRAGERDPLASVARGTPRHP